MVAKKRGNARKTPEIVRFRGFEAMISFLASRYGCGGGTLNILAPLGVSCGEVSRDLLSASQLTVILRDTHHRQKSKVAQCATLLFWLRRWDL